MEIWTRSKVVVIANRNTIIEEKENPYYRLEKAHFDRQKAEYDLDLLQNEQDLADWEPQRKANFTMTGEDMGELRIDKGEILIDSSSDPSHKSDPSYAQARKYLRNGLLFIERNGIRYTAQGQRID